MKNLAPRNALGQPHGLWVRYHGQTKLKNPLWFKGWFFNGKEIGYWIVNDGVTNEKEYFIR